MAKHSDRSILLDVYTKHSDSTEKQAVDNRVVREGLREANKKNSLKPSF